MTLLAVGTAPPPPPWAEDPYPTRMVPLTLREQAAVRDRWLTQRLLDVLPGLMDRAGIDLRAWRRPETASPNSGAGRPS